MTHLLLYHHHPPNFHPSALQPIPDPNPILPYTPIHNYMPSRPGHSIRLVRSLTARSPREFGRGDGLSWSDNMGEIEEFVDI
jgi:hypothetical protein